MKPAWLLVALALSACDQGAATEFRAERIGTFEDIATGPDTLSASVSFAGGVRMFWDRKNFRGFSGLLVSAGTRLTAVSDRGAWFQGRLVLEGGRLVGLVPAQLERFNGPDGARIKRSDADAEALASDGRGGYLVAFERRARLLNYPPWRKPFSLAPRSIAAPEDLASFPPNAGIEALTRLCDGGLLAIAQEQGKDRSPDAWLFRDGTWSPRRYARADGFSPTGATTLADCSVAVLERRRDADKREHFRVQRLEMGQLAPNGDENIATQPLIAAARGQIRYEGIAADRSAARMHRLYLISDSGKSEPTVILAFDVER